MISRVVRVSVEHIELVNKHTITTMDTNSIKLDLEMISVLLLTERGIISKHRLHLQTGHYGFSRVGEDANEVISFGGNEHSTASVENWQAQLSHSDDNRGEMGDTPLSGGGGEATEIRHEDGHIKVLIRVLNVTFKGRHALSLNDVRWDRILGSLDLNKLEVEIWERWSVLDIIIAFLGDVDLTMLSCVLTKFGGGVDWISPMDIRAGVVEDLTLMDTESRDIDLLRESGVGSVVLLQLLGDLEGSLESLSWGLEEP